MPGVRKNWRLAAEAIERYQPYNQQWLGWLDTLINPNKHYELTKHDRYETELWPSFPEAFGTGSMGVLFKDITFKIDDRPVTASEFFGREVDEIETKELRFSSIGLSVPTVLDFIRKGTLDLVQTVQLASGLPPVTL